MRHAIAREQVFALIKAHLADELDVDPGAISEGTRFREDLEADSLDLYTLVQELEDTYGVHMSDDQAAQILTVGQAAQRLIRPPGVPGGQRAGAGRDHPSVSAAGGRAVRRRATDEDPRADGIRSLLSRCGRTTGD